MRLAYRRGATPVAAPAGEKSRRQTGALTLLRRACGFKLAHDGVDTRSL
jgi:hypothetical protein